MSRIVKIAAWAATAILTVVLLSVARHEQDSATVKKPVVTISAIDENIFLTEAELLTRLGRKQLVFAGQKMEQLRTTEIEAFIRSMHEVQNVEVFRRMGGEWAISIRLRQPIARIFNRKGQSFYLDAEGTTMDPSPNFTARVMVFSGNIPDKSDTLTVNEIINNASLKSSRLLDDIYRISNYVCHDPFLRAQIAQVHRTSGGDFIMIPQVGDHRIIFGSARTDREVKEKLDKLKVFYREGLPYEGWNKYESIDLKFRDQIVCKKKQAETENTQTEE
jgi:cell division protein FtsQ